MGILTRLNNLLRSYDILINIRIPTKGDIKDEISELRQK